MGTDEPAPDPSRIIIPLSKPIVVGGPSLRQEWLLIAGLGVLATACLTIDAFTLPKEFGEGTRTPLSWVAVILGALGQGGWITLDRQRRGLEIGYWRFGAILLGPIVISIYLILEYRLRALYLIPLLAAIYLGIAVLPWGIWLVAGLSGK
jgi:hypothetical protein